MQRHTHRTLIATIRDHVVDWQRENGWSRESVSDQIVQAHERIGGPRMTGVVFDPPTRDTYERMRVNADRIFRWLDDSTKDKNLLPANFIHSIFAALPPDRRLQLADDILFPLGLSVCPCDESTLEPTAREVVVHFKAVLVSANEATGSMAELLDGVDRDEPERAHAKLGLAAAAISRARGLMARLMKRGKK